MWPSSLLNGTQVGRSHRAALVLGKFPIAVHFSAAYPSPSDIPFGGLILCPPLVANRVLKTDGDPVTIQPTVVRTWPRRRGEGGLEKAEVCYLGCSGLSAKVDMEGGALEASRLDKARRVTCQ